MKSYTSVLIVLVGLATAFAAFPDEWITWKQVCVLLMCMNHSFQECPWQLVTQFCLHIQMSHTKVAIAY